MDEDIPSIFSEETPSIPVAYFNGPWLPMFHVGEFIGYSLDLDNPLQVLEIKERRENIIYGLTKLLSSNPQPNLFSSVEDINDRFEDFLKIRDSGKGLYTRWRQNTKGKLRDLVKAKEPLDLFLRNYVLPIIKQAPCHPTAHGGEEGWSVKRSLETHLPLGSVFSFDLKGAFNQVDHQYVFDFYYSFFKSRLEEDSRRDLAGFLTHLSTVSNEYEAHLPQGSPTSISLFNRVLYPIDELLSKKSKERGLRYSRWIDDMIISAPEKNRNLGRMAGSMKVVRSDFPIHLNKIFWQQDLPEYYLLGHKINGKAITPVNKDEAKNEGLLVDRDLFFSERDLYCEEWTEEWIEEKDFVQNIEDL